MPINLQQLASQINRNCAVSDAEHATDFGMCSYLLKMREFYRWENSVELQKELSNEEVTNWIQKKEKFWQNIGSEYSPLIIENNRYDPFDNQAINQYLLPHKLFYHSGLGKNCSSLFFLGKLEKIEQHETYKIITVAEEYARNMHAPPAMCLADTIIIRFDILQRFCWDKVQEWNWSQRDNVMGKALSHYKFSTQPEQSLRDMATNFQQIMIWHEIGEFESSNLLPNWQKILTLLSYHRLEPVVRAVKDLLADCLVTLPKLMESESSALITLYFANYSGFQKQLFPQLYKCYQEWTRDSSAFFGMLIRKGESDWLQVSQEIQDLQDIAAIEDYLSKKFNV